MRNSAGCLFVSALLIFNPRVARLDAQQQDTSKHATTRDTRAYSSSPSDFIVGRHVFLRSTKTPIGTITAADPNKSFPRTFPRSHMKAVLIEHAGGKGWVPLEGITRIYVTR